MTPLLRLLVVLNSSIFQYVSQLERSVTHVSPPPPPSAVKENIFFSGVPAHSFNQNKEVVQLAHFGRPF